MTLATDEPPLVAELLDDQGQSVLPPASVPTQQALELPAGDYTLRVSAPGRLSETMHVEIPRGKSLKHSLSLRDRALWPTIDVPRAVVAVAGQAHDNLLLFGDAGLSLIDGTNAGTRWTLNLANGEQSLVAGPLVPGLPSIPALGQAEAEPPLVAAYRGALWSWDRGTGYRYPSGFGPFDLRPLVLGAKMDLNGDGVPDYLLAARHQAWLLAVSGSGGQRLWFAPRGADVTAAPPMTGLPSGVVSAVLAAPEKLTDVDNDGVDDVLVVFGDLGRPLDQVRTRRVGVDPKSQRSFADPDTPESQARRWVEAVSRVNATTARLLALKADDGKRLWSWETAVAPQSGQVGDANRRAERPKPNILRRRDGQNLICLNLKGTPGSQGRGEVVSLDKRGNVVSRIELATMWNHFRVWTDDLNGDGQGDLLFLDGNTLRAVDPLTTSRIWESPLSAIFGSSSLLGPLPSRRGPSLFVAFEPGAVANTRGLDGASGDRRWSYAPPGAAMPSSLKEHVLDLQTTDAPPTIQYIVNGTTVCGRAYSVAQATPAAVPAANVRPALRDPRLARSLPWQLHPSASDELASVSAWAGFYCATLWVLPAVTLWWTLRHFRWSLRTLALLHLTGGVFLAACLAEGPENREVSHFGRFATGATALPIALMLVLLIRSTINRRWRQLRAWLGLSVALAVVFAAVALARDWDLRSEGEYYSLQGCYWIWLIAAYVVCIAVSVAYAARAVWRWYDGRCPVIVAKGATKHERKDYEENPYK